MVKPTDMNGAANDVYTREGEFQKIVGTVLNSWTRAAVTEACFFEVVGVLDKHRGQSAVFDLPRAAITPKTDLVAQ